MLEIFGGRFKQYAAALTVSILTLCTGIASSWTSPTIPLLEKDDSPIGVKLSKDESAWVVSIINLGNLLGNLMLGKCLDIFGRRGSLLIAAVPLLACWIMILLAKSLVVLYIARFILGMCIAFPTTGSVIYIGEISEPAVRGKLGIFNLFMIEAGIAFVTAVGNYVSYENLAIICAIFPVVFVLIFYWMPESPYFYLRKQNIDRAKKSLQRLRANTDVDKELLEMQCYVDKEMKNKSKFWDLFRTPKYRRAIFIVIGLKTLQQMAGSLAINSYMKTIFDQTSTGLDSSISSIICTLVPLPTMLIASHIVDRGGRKPLYYVSTLGCTIALLCEFVYFFLQDNLKEDMSSLGWLPIFGIFFFYVFRSVGVASIPYIIISELFPTNIKGIAASVTLVYSAALGFLVTLLFPILVDAWGMYLGFLIFAIFCFLGFFFVLIFVPETKGKSFSDIQTDIDKKFDT